MDIPYQVTHALHRLKQNGFRAYIVGGAVRDMVCHQSTSDWDITTNAPTEAIHALFSNENILPIGLAHDTVHVLLHGCILEITPFRGNDDKLYNDLAKRDFTINALAYSEEEGIIDYFNGVEDIAKKTVRAVGSAQKRFLEDPLRVLRALRFASQLSMTIDYETIMAFVSIDLSHVAVERIREEITKILLGSNVRTVLRRYGWVLSKCIPEIAPMIGFDQHNPYHIYDVWYHTIEVIAHTPPIPVLRWAALFHDMGKPLTFTQEDNGLGHFYGHQKKSHVIAQTIMKRLKFSNEWFDTIQLLVEKHDISIPKTLNNTKHLLRRVGEQNLQLLLKLFEGDCAGQSSKSAERYQEIQNLKGLIEKALAEKATFTRLDLALNGTDLIALGLSGKDIGLMLEKLVHAVVYESCDNTKEALLSLVQAEIAVKNEHM